MVHPGQRSGYFPIILIIVSHMQDNTFPAPIGVFLLGKRQESHIEALPLHFFLAGANQPDIPMTKTPISMCAMMIQCDTRYAIHDTR